MSDFLISDPAQFRDPLSIPYYQVAKEHFGQSEEGPFCQVFAVLPGGSNFQSFQAIMDTVFMCKLHWHD